MTASRHRTGMCSWLWKSRARARELPRCGTTRSGYSPWPSTAPRSLGLLPDAVVFVAGDRSRTTPLRPTGRMRPRRLWCSASGGCGSHPGSAFRREASCPLPLAVVDRRLRLVDQVVLRLADTPLSVVDRVHPVSEAASTYSRAFGHPTIIRAHGVRVDPPCLRVVRRALTMARCGLVQGRRLVATVSTICGLHLLDLLTRTSANTSDDGPLSTPRRSAAEAASLFCTRNPGQLGCGLVSPSVR